ncbi:MAG: hypothetical protein Q9200_006792 [Gallowayella weberi]
MATPNTSHYKPAPTPRPPTSTSAMTPASFSASSPAAPPSNHSTGPGHRSHASPAHFSSSSSSTTKAGKSPFNHLQQSHLLVSAVGGQPMSRNATNTSSPGTIGSLGAYAGLNGMLMNAVEGGNFKTGLTPAGGIGTPGVDGVSPLPSNLGIGEGAGASMNGSLVRQQARDQEEERRLRLENIVRLLGDRWGYVSREGVERCARRIGLECLWEDEVPGAQGRTLSIAGNSVLVDVMFLKDGDEVRSVTLAFPEREEGQWGKAAEKGAKVLKTDLEGQEEDTLGYVGLQPFFGNLQRLGTLDRLGTGGVSCFDALDGVGGALRKVWKIETKRRKQGKDQESVEVDVMCKETGKPSMHSGGRLGLALQYWMDRRHLASRKRKADEMDIDSATEETAAERSSIWSAVIECQSSAADLYPSIRVSSDWVSEASEKPLTDQQDPFSGTDICTSLISWQDPPPTFIASEPPTSAAMDTDTNPLLQQQKSPDVRFVARLHPPVLVPMQTAVNILSSVGIQEAMQPTTYDSLLLPKRDGTPSTSTTERVTERDMSVPAGEHGSVEIKRHQYTLFTDAQSYARNIEEIPFSHPRQIVTLLPVLRQWAFVSTILRRCFDNPARPDQKEKARTNGNTGLMRNSHHPDADNDDYDNDDDDDSDIAPSTALHNLLHPEPSSSSKHQATAIDISLSLSASSPRISIVFPQKQTGLTNVNFSVDANAEITNVDVTVASMRRRHGRSKDANGGTTSTTGDAGGAEDEKTTARRKEKVKKVLELGEDIGLLVEWMRKSG